MKCKDNPDWLLTDHLAMVTVLVFCVTTMAGRLDWSSEKILTLSFRSYTKIWVICYHKKCLAWYGDINGANGHNSRGTTRGWRLQVLKHFSYHLSFNSKLKLCWLYILYFYAVPILIFLIILKHVKFNCSCVPIYLCVRLISPYLVWPLIVKLIDGDTLLVSLWF